MVDSVELRSLSFEFDAKGKTIVGVTKIIDASF